MVAVELTSSLSNCIIKWGRFLFLFHPYAYVILAFQLKFRLVVILQMFCWNRKREGEAG